MKKFFKDHSEAVLISLAILFIVAVVGCLYMTIQLVIPQVNRTLVSPQAAGTQGFDLAGAATIDYKGISTSTLPTSSPATSAVTASTSASTSTTVTTSTTPGKAATTTASTTAG